MIGVIMETFAIEIVARGEGLRYSEGERVWNFNISLDSQDEWTLYTGKWSDSLFREMATGSYEQKVVIPRVVKFLEERDLNKGVRYRVRLLPE